MPTITKPRPIADKNNDIKFTNTSFLVAWKALRLLGQTS